MLPGHIVGTLSLDGKEQPFVLDTATGKVSVGERRDADPMQRNMARDEKRAAVARVESEVPAAKNVAI